MKRNNEIKCQLHFETIAKRYWLLDKNIRNEIDQCEECGIKKKNNFLNMLLEVKSLSSKTYFDDYQICGCSSL